MAFFYDEVSEDERLDRVKRAEKAWEAAIEEHNRATTEAAKAAAARKTRLAVIAYEAALAAEGE